MKYWAGSNIKKSNSNAFNWKGEASDLMKDPTMKRIQAAKRQVVIEPRYSGLLLTTTRKNNE
jgi:hypothetical protein